MLMMACSIQSLEGMEKDTSQSKKSLWGRVTRKMSPKSKPKSSEVVGEKEKENKEKEEKNNKLLLQAAQEGNVEAVVEALDAVPGGANPQTRNSEGNTAYHLAALGGHKDVLAALIERCPRGVLLRNYASQTPLMAIMMQDIPASLMVSQARILRQLLQVDESLIDKANAIGDTPLHVAVKANRFLFFRVLMEYATPELLLNRRNNERQTVDDLARIAAGENASLVISEIEQELSIPSKERTSQRMRTRVQCPTPRTDSDDTQTIIVHSDDSQGRGSVDNLRTPRYVDVDREEEEPEDKSDDDEAPTETDAGVMSIIEDAPPVTPEYQRVRQQTFDTDIPVNIQDVSGHDHWKPTGKLDSKFYEKFGAPVDGDAANFFKKKRQAKDKPVLQQQENLKAPSPLNVWFKRVALATGIALVIERTYDYFSQKSKSASPEN